MKNKPAYICFYLETYTYIALKGNDLLVYNTTVSYTHLTLPTIA